MRKTISIIALLALEGFILACSKAEKPTCKAI